MKFTIEISPEKNPDAVGEYLRSTFFDEGKNQGLGCYSAFGWDIKVKVLPALMGREDESEIWTCGELEVPEGKIECRYYWDGDGTLVFIFPDGSRLTNNDCKKCHDWIYDE